jgi:hypothetical protein
MRTHRKRKNTARHPGTRSPKSRRPAAPKARRKRGPAKEPQGPAAKPFAIVPRFAAKGARTYLADPEQLMKLAPLVAELDKALRFADRSGGIRFLNRNPDLRKDFICKPVA